MTDHDFDRIVRQAMTDVAGHTAPDDDLAARLIANTREGRVTVVPLAARARRGARWTTPLLAAAAVVVVAGGVVVGTASLGSGHHKAPVGSHVPTPVPSVVHSPSPTPAPTRPLTPAHPGFAAQDVDFSDATHGWALGTDRKRALLLRTTDGSHWTAAPLPSGLRPPSDSSSCGTNGTITGPCVDHVLFADARHGYLWSLHELYLTSNGGRSWTREPHSPGHPGATRLVVAGSHAVRMRPIADCSAGCDGILQTATLGSDTWTTVTPTRSGLYTSALAVTNGAVYFMAGSHAGPSGNVNDKAVGGGVFRSTDGRHWVKLGNTCGIDQTAIVAAADGTVALDCSRTVRLLNPGTSTFGTGHPVPSGGEFTYALFAVTSPQELFWAGDTRVFRSTDAGRSVQQISTVALNTSAPLPVALSEHFMYVTSRTGSAVLVSTDGGISWQARPF